MDAKTIIIIALIIFGIYWYMNPDKGKDILDQGVDKVKSVVGDIDILPCPTTYDPVCGNGTTYQNKCEADKAGVNSTVGECPI